MDCRYNLSYSYWNWRLKSGVSFKDPRIYKYSTKLNSRLVTLALSYSVNANASATYILENVLQIATQNVFIWPLFKGKRPINRDIFNHKWLRDLDSIDKLKDDVLAILSLGSFVKS